MGKASGERRPTQQDAGRVYLVPDTARMLDWRLKPLASAFLPYRQIDLSGPQCQVSGTRQSHHGTGYRYRVPVALHGFSDP